MNTKFIILLVIAVTSGLLITWIDISPGWDDTGITAGMIVVVTGTLGAIMPRRAALWAIAVGVWIPLWNLSHGNNYSAIAALFIAIVGAFAGAFAQKMFGNNSAK